MTVRTLSSLGQVTDPYRNLAIEKYLLDNSGPDDVWLFLWQNRDTVVIGRNQNPWRECNVELLHEEGGKLARRMSGGGAVWHDLGNLNFSFIAGQKDYDISKQLSVIASAAKSFGIAVQRTGRNDIWVGGRKFSGNAFINRMNARCHHGTILIDADMARMIRYLDTGESKMSGRGVESVRSRVVNLKEFNPRLTPALFADALLEAFRMWYVAADKVCLTHLDETEIRDNEDFFSEHRWLYGETRTFNIEKTGDFLWGSVRMHYRVDGGIISDARMESDGLTAELLSAVADVCIGAPWKRTEIVRRLRTLVPANEEEEIVLRDLVTVISHKPKEVMYDI